jgi:hypothetical protein
VKYRYQSPAENQLDTALRGVLDGIRHQVDQGLPQPNGICLDDQRNAARDLHGQCQTLVFRMGAHQGLDVGDQGVEFAGRNIGSELAGFDF